MIFSAFHWAVSPIPKSGSESQRKSWKGANEANRRIPSNAKKSLKQCQHSVIDNSFCIHHIQLKTHHQFILSFFVDSTKFHKFRQIHGEVPVPTRLTAESPAMLMDNSFWSIILNFKFDLNILVDSLVSNGDAHPCEEED